MDKQMYLSPFQSPWMGKRVGIKAADFDVCALSVIHIPESERKP